MSHVVVDNQVGCAIRDANELVFRRQPQENLLHLSPLPNGKGIEDLVLTLKASRIILKTKVNIVVASTCEHGSHRMVPAC